MAKYYLSKNYSNISNAGNKAKTDFEKILTEQGYKSAGLPQTINSNKIIGFILTLIGVLKVFFTVSANDVVFIQYPFKKYYTFVCRIIHLKKGKVVTLIHDLGTFRRKRLTAEKEIIRLSHSDALIVHNESMKNWLLQQGYTKPMVCIGIFDYLSSTANDKSCNINESPIKVIYAGALSYKKNRYLYSLDKIISNWKFELYGSGFEDHKIKNKEHFNYKGFIPSDRLIENIQAHFGLVWDGDSVSACSGNFGEYLKINNPHKAALYIRSNLPLIVWKESALAHFVIENKIGICVHSLAELNTVLPSIAPEAYNEMRNNIRKICEKVASGHYITNALNEAKSLIGA